MPETRNVRGWLLIGALCLGFAAPAVAEDGGPRILAATLRLGDAQDPEERGWLVLEVEAELSDDEMERIYFEVEGAGDEPYLLATGDFLSRSASGRAVGLTYWAPEPSECGTTFEGSVLLVEAPEDAEEPGAPLGRSGIQLAIPADFCVEFEDFEADEL